MRNSIFQRRIPTVLGLLLVGTGIFISSWFLQNGALLPTQAGTATTPQNVRISNVTDTSFTLSYSTTDKVLGVVIYGEDEKRALDVRDSTGIPSTYTTHYIIVKDLAPSTEYSYKILSGNKEYLKDGASFTFTTPATLAQNNLTPLSVSGKVTLSGGEPAIVYISLAGSQMLSVLTDNDGAFSLNQQSIRTKNFSQITSLNADSPLTVLLSDGAGSSRISTTLGKANPLPQVSLSQNYDFSLGSESIGAFNATDSANLAGFPSLEVDEPADTTNAEIITPEKNEGFSDQQPEFNGKALPNEEVEIIIHSDEIIKTKVKSNSRGSWSYRPDKPLSPGEHTLTIRTRDSFGILKEIQQSFIVYAEGSQFTDPSVSPVKSPTPSKSPTPTLTPTKTPSPSTGASIAPTSKPSPTIIVSISLTPAVAVAVPSISPVDAPPDAGSTSLILSGLVGIVTLSVGLFVLFMSRGGAL